MPIISAFPTGENTVDYTGPKSGLPSLEEGKVAYVTDEKRLYTGNADGTNTQVPNADDVKTDVSDAVSSHNSATNAHADQFAKYLPLSGGTMTRKIVSDGTVIVSQGSPSVTGKSTALTLLKGDRTESDYSGISVYNAKSLIYRPLIGVLHMPDEGMVSRMISEDETGLQKGYVVASPTGVAIGSTEGVSIEDVKNPTKDTDAANKKYVDDAIKPLGNLTPSACKVTLSASGWDSTAKTQSATVSGVLEDESKQLIMPMPAGTSMSAYNEAGIQMTAQAANTVTFTADTVPTADVEVWVVVQSVNDVTPPPPPALDEATWDYISQQSLAGNAKNIWAVGDCKKIKLSGTASKLNLNTELYVYILDFDHDASAVGGTKDGITFGTFKTALTGGKDVCLMSGYDDDNDFRMNTTGTNAGGWKNSDMRYNILGSTNTQNGNATATTATSPKANTLMSCFPADLRAVMRPMCIYTDNTGGGSDTASYVTATIDFLPFLAEFEIHGARTSANSAEQNNQSQYAYFKNGNTKVKYRFNSQSSTFYWWSRSLSSNGSRGFCFVNASGSANNTNANYSNGVAPMFKV